MPPMRPASSPRHRQRRPQAEAFPSQACWPIPASGSGPGQRPCWSRPWPCAAIASARARPQRSGRSTACPAGFTRPPGPSCNWAPSAPPPGPGRRGVAGRGPRAGGPAPGGRHQRLGTVEGRQADGTAAQASDRLPGTRCRGPEAAGLRIPVRARRVAMARLGAAALPRLGTAGRALTLSAVPVVGLTRVYVGAHLPLDVAGGMALGLAIEAAMTLVNSCIAQPAPRGKQRAPLAHHQLSERQR